MSTLAPRRTEAFAVALLLGGMLSAGLVSGQYNAVAIMNVGSVSVSGEVTFTELVDCSIAIVGTLSGLKPNFKHGLHIHAFGDVSLACDSTGGHWNPTSETHGDLNANMSHAGDLGNVQTNDSGVAVFNLTSHAISKLGIPSLFGRALVIHNGTDDLGLGNNSASHVNGNSGTRLACGIIGIAASAQATAFTCGTASTSLSTTPGPVTSVENISSLALASATTTSNALLTAVLPSQTPDTSSSASAPSSAGQNSQTPTAASVQSLKGSAPDARATRDAAIFTVFFVWTLWASNVPCILGI